MGPKKKAAAASVGRQGLRSQKSVSEIVQGTVDDVNVKKPRKTKDRVAASTSVSETDNLVSAVPKVPTPLEKTFQLKSILRKRDPTPAVRAARRISQTAMRRLSSTNVRLSGGRFSGVYRPAAGAEDIPIEGRYSLLRKSFRKSVVRSTRVRIRESINDVLNISCLPDKVPGRVRMPDSPPTMSDAAEAPAATNASAKRKKPVRRKATAAKGRKKKKPAFLLEPPIMEELKDVDEELGELPFTQEESSDHRHSPIQQQHLSVNSAGHVMARRDRIQSQDAGGTASAGTGPNLILDDIMFADEPAEPQSPRPVSRNRRRSFIEAERKMKELQKPRFHVPPSDDDFAGTRRRRYSVSARKIQENSLVDLTVTSSSKPPIRAGLPVVVKDEELNSLWKRIKDNSDLNYPTDFPGSKILAMYHRKTLEAENGNGESVIPWTEIYRPRSAKEFIGNRAAVASLREWLVKWKKRLQRHESILLKSKEKTATRRRRDQKDDDEWTEEDDLETELINLAFVLGPTGIGKTCLVHALAEELGFKVIEVNCSSLRGHKQIVSNLEGATQTQRLNLHTIAPSKNKQRAGAVASSSTSNSIQKFFAPSTKKSWRKTPPTAPCQTLDVITIDDNDDVAPSAPPVNNNTERPMSLILFDDVDIIFEMDERFWQGVREIAQTALVPILMTCKDYQITDFPMNDLKVEVVQFHPINEKRPALYFRLLLLSRRIVVENEADFMQYCEQFNGDLRACLAGLEFWLDNSARTVSKSAKNRRRAKTPPFVPPQLIATIRSTEIDGDDDFGFDWFKYEMRSIRDRYSPEVDLKWPARVLDGLADRKPAGSIKDDTLEIESAPDTSIDRFGSIFGNLLDHSRFEDDRVLASVENVQQISAFNEITSNTCQSSAMIAFHRKSFVIDYLPILRSIAAADKDAKAAACGRRGRRLRYLHRSGLDDRSGILQTMLEENPFKEL